jgi:pyruvate ferredoxin oxidoreductase beta subunit
MKTNAKTPIPGGIPEDASSLRGVLEAYGNGSFDSSVTADALAARSLMPPATARVRDFSYVATEMPRFTATKCITCMECVNVCPDTAILAKVTPEDTLEDRLEGMDLQVAAGMERHMVRHPKFFGAMQKKGRPGGVFSIFVDPSKCKGCAECVEVCPTHALEMEMKQDGTVEKAREEFGLFKELPVTPEDYLTKAPGDAMLSPEAQLYVGGAGSCMGCGEGTAIRLMLAATGRQYGGENIGILASTGCNSVYASTYPYNPYKVSWANSLFENSPTFAMGVRLKWNQRGWAHKRLWVLGGDGAMNDIGFQALSRMLMSGMDIKVLVLDTQAYSNTGGQASTASFLSQNAKMAFHGKSLQGKQERRKELAEIAMMHPDIYVAQTITSNLNHFYRAVQGANDYPGPALVNVYATCQPEHGVGDDTASRQSKLAADCRVFPLLIHDPRKGDMLKERLSLQGNVSPDKNYFIHPKTGETFDFIHWARTEGRFAKHFDKEGKPSVEMLKAADDRLKNWRLLQELAGIL